VLLAPTWLAAQSPGLEFGAVVQRYTDDWMRFHTNAASARRHFTGVEEDAIERLIEPVTRKGQACSYMIGELKIVELREKARTALGSRFSLAEFHNRVLGAGRVPLDVLQQDIERWIAEKRN
jgi:uncharacterized protein (DUF885 family)